MATATFDLAHHRHTERAIVRKLDLSDDERRDLMEGLTGHRSSTELSPEEWGVYVAELQRLAGRASVRYGKPQLRSQRRPEAGGRRPSRQERPYPLDNSATEEQLAYIADLRPRIEWIHPDGPEVGFRAWAATVLYSGKRNAVGRMAWVRSSASLASLSRREASLLIRALHKEAAAHPAKREEGEGPTANLSESEEPVNAR